MCRARWSAVPGGTARVIVRGESIDDLLARDLGVPTSPHRGRAAAPSPEKGMTDDRRLRVALLGAGRGIAASCARTRTSSPTAPARPRTWGSPYATSTPRDADLPRELFTDGCRGSSSAPTSSSS
jgi:hypothetical protein